MFHVLDGVGYDVKEQESFNFEGDSIVFMSGPIGKITALFEFGAFEIIVKLL